MLTEFEQGAKPKETQYFLRSVRLFLHKVLLVEDDPFVSALSEAFLRTHFDVRIVSDANGALKALSSQAFDLVLMDLGLPDEDGLVLARQVKAKYPETLIIYLTSRDTKEDMLAGLEIGGDDYIVKPFDPDILLARIGAVLRRGASRRSEPSKLIVALDQGNLEIDTQRRRVAITGKGEISLTRAEFDIIAILAKAAGRVLSRGQLLDAIATRPDHDADERVIDALVSKIRRKMTPLGLTQSPVETVRGLGYRIASS